MTTRDTTPPVAGEASFVVVTGFSGAGKSHAIRALEDLGYYCVDNLPIALLPTFADLSLNSTHIGRRAAVVIDVRERDAIGQFPAAYRRLQRLGGPRVRLLFLEADERILLRRFSETRRPHPLAGTGSVADGLAAERQLLAPIRRLADQVVDTTGLTVHELRRRVRELLDHTESHTALVVTLLSFGFRRGVPADADLVFDVRFLPNPHFVPSLRRWTGRNARVSRYVLRTKPAIRFMKLTTDLLRFLIPQYIAEGKAYLTIAIGCTGGKHRSVALVEAFAKRLRTTKGIDLRVRHRDERDS
ncbi:MAG: RNase adaptor protein RapZ [Acidobacteria bacterium SCN 69-37]|nr:MAG: RNase adaptor protein RapZ [Acidobacteria bacterium SCN 69-37]